MTECKQCLNLQRQIEALKNLLAEKGVLLNAGFEEIEGLNEKWSMFGEIEKPCEPFKEERCVDMDDKLYEPDLSLEGQRLLQKYLREKEVKG